MGSKTHVHIDDPPEQYQTGDVKRRPYVADHHIGRYLEEDIREIRELANASSITLPEGLSNHGDPTILCRPADWADITAFFLINYIAHAATIVTNPGEKFPSVLFTSLLAVLFPVVGILRGTRAIRSMAFNAKSELQKAARAGALCFIQEDNLAYPGLRHLARIELAEEK